MAGTIAIATCLGTPEPTPSDQLYIDALERRGLSVAYGPWNGRQAPFEAAETVVLRSTWGYYLELDSFRAWLEATAVARRLLNPLAIVRANLRKDYVLALAAAGVRVPQSHFVPCTADALAGVFARTGWASAVVKPASGASGYSVELVERDAAAAAVGKLAAEAHTTGIVVQEFLPQIAEGELSLIYFNGVYSHAVRKIPAAGEFRVNSHFNATRQADAPEAAIVDDGMAALRSLPEMPLYARVDGVVRENRLVVIELELIEPALFLDFDPPSAERFADATIALLGV